jgi:NSS family neurotransmitter:Na+ symporter
MTVNNKSAGERKWSSNLMFMAAAIGSAVGISNVWKFTYVAGENGGGAFVLVYITAIAFIALPALIAEFLVGRRGGASVVKSMDNLSQREGIHRAWRYYGQMAALVLLLHSVFTRWWRAGPSTIFSMRRWLASPA